MGREFIKLFDEWAESYDNTVVGYDEEYKEVFEGYDEILEEVASKVNETIIEFGVGTGNLSKKLLEKGHNVIGIEHLPDSLHQGIVGMKKMVPEDGDREISSWDEMEQRYIFEALRKNHCNRAATAAQLGIHTTTLWRKIKHLHLEIPKQDG